MRRVLRAEVLLPLTILAGAAMLGFAQFLTMFELTPPGAEPLLEVSAADQHSFWLLIPAVFAVASTMMAIGSGERAFAYAGAAFGVSALLLFLILDLPDAGKLGTLGGDSEFTYSTARAEPQTGFVLEAVGSIVLALSTIVFATFRGEQLRAPLRLFGSPGGATDEPRDDDASTREEPGRHAQRDHARGRRPGDRRSSGQDRRIT